jgi:hypothetical protein
MKTSLLILSFLIACDGQGDAGKPPPPAPPPFEAGKSDALRRVAFQGALSDEAEVTAAFTKDLSFHGWAFDVFEAGPATLDITRTGTSRRLDTTLFVFGPLHRRSFGDEAIASDDDGGWGAHPRLHTDLAPGRYLAVVGTATGVGRGHYRLDLRCAGCTARPPGPDPCPEEMDRWIETCVKDVGNDLWVAPAVAWHECSGYLWDGEYGEAELCDSDPFVSRPTWCSDFSLARDECEWHWNDHFFVDPAVTTTPLGTGATLEALEDEAEAACDGCLIGLRVHRYDAATPPTATEAVAAIIRDAFDADPAWHIEGQIPRGELDQRLSELQLEPLISIAVRRASSNLFHVGRARYSRQPPPFDEDDAELWVFTFPETRWFVTVEVYP